MKPTQKAGILDVVKRLINRGNENKLVGQRMEVAVGHNSAIGTADCLSVLPPMVQGTDSNQRIGDRVTPKSLTIKGVVSLVREQPDARELYVRVLVLAQKNIKVGSDVNTSVDAAHLLRTGIAGGDEIQYTGATQNINDPINRDLFRVYMDKTFVLAPASDQTLTGPLPKSSFKWGYSFKQLPASLTYDATNTQYANNFAPFYAIGYAYADGTAPDVGTLRIVTTTSSYLQFEDS